jgi:acyl-CoA synthetase (AMP-forming)/AMP-acid ligase II
MTDFTTIRELLNTGCRTEQCFGAPERLALDYAGLRTLADVTVARLNELGVDRNDRVAIVLPNSPEMASAFVTIGCGATTAPLNPAYREDEFDFYLDDLNAKVLVVEDGSESPALAVAVKRNIPVLTLVADAAGPAGNFILKGDGVGRAATNGGMAGPDDVSLVLHTSGTTSRPKIVPLTQRNVTASARHIGASLHLVSGDKCLNIMPLFHIHGLIAAVLSSLAAGASVYCAPGFNALRVFSWLDEVEPTWYTAVPTMHQTILSRSARNPESVERARKNLRLVRSSSASLPPQVMRELEDTFDAPVVEAYGMTEAAHQMACNPLPPAARKPGSVGIAAGPEVAIMSETAGDILDVGGIGEIVIRGPNVTPGYESNPEANATAFTNGWFRTGDQGVMDDEGYISITGRLKEIINRGGEKISPREVDEVLMDHPAVAQAVTFAVPHEKLGEDVAAAIVLREGEQIEERDARDFVAQKLADFKVPRKVVILDEIPKGATGKLQRIGLAEKLGLV